MVGTASLAMHKWKMSHRATRSLHGVLKVASAHFIVYGKDGSFQIYHIA